jgi:hypothetical protein
MVGKITTLPNVGFGFVKWFLKNGEGCWTEYSEGTAVARWSLEYLKGTAEEMMMVMFD